MNSIFFQSSVNSLLNLPNRFIEGRWRSSHSVVLPPDRSSLLIVESDSGLSSRVRLLEVTGEERRAKAPALGFELPVGSEVDFSGSLNLTDGSLAFFRG